jgi:hypothetical protein
VAGRFWASERRKTLPQKITFSELMCIKIESVMYEYEGDAETDVSRPGETAHKQNFTPHNDYKILYAVLLYWLCTASTLIASMSSLRKR